VKELIPKSSTLIFLILIIFLSSIFLGYKFLLKNLENNHETKQKILFYEIQKHSNTLLTKLLYDYSLKKEVILSKHKEVLKYLETNSYDGNLNEIYEKINEGLEDKPYNIYITDENLVIKNTTFKQDLGFDLNFAKNLFDKHEKEKIIGVSAPVFETSSINFFSFSDSYLPKNKKRLLQISYKYSDVDFNLKLIQNSIDSNENIENSISYIVFNDGYIGDFIFKSFKSFKPNLNEITNRLEKGKELAKKIADYEYMSEEFIENNKQIKIMYFSEKTAIYKDAKIIYSIIFDETKHIENIKLLNNMMYSLFLIGVITLFFIYRIRNKEYLLSYKDKFIEHSMHEIKTPLSIIKLNNELRNKVLGVDKYSTKIEAAIKTLQNSYEDMTFLHTKNYISYNLEILSLRDVLTKRVSYFKSVSTAQGRVLNLEIDSNCLIKISKIEIERLIDNNLSNAIKYSTVNSIITINLSNNILSFKTFGKEIRDKNKVFKRYQRENENHGGHGLGLSIIKDICKKYKIDIELKYEDAQNIFIYNFNCHTNDTK
jgi:hypothetical protein